MGSKMLSHTSLISLPPHLIKIGLCSSASSQGCTGDRNLTVPRSCSVDCRSPPCGVMDFDGDALPGVWTLRRSDGGFTVLYVSCTTDGDGAAPSWESLGFGEIREGAASTTSGVSCSGMTGSMCTVWLALTGSCTSDRSCSEWMGEIGATTVGSVWLGLSASFAWLGDVSSFRNSWLPRDPVLTILARRLPPAFPRMYEIWTTLTVFLEIKKDFV